MRAFESYENFRSAMMFHGYQPQPAPEPNKTLGDPRDHFKTNEPGGYRAVKPNNGVAYTTIELNAIWELECDEEDILHARALMNEYHAYTVKDWHDFTVAGINDEIAIDLIKHAQMSDMFAGGEKLGFALQGEHYDPEWPCKIDHEAHVEELAEDGWIHGDPEDYQDPS